jgi:hypothetical protein
MLKERQLALRELAITIAVLSLFFLLPSWLPQDFNRILGIAVQVVLFVAGCIYLFRVWRRYGIRR